MKLYALLLTFFVITSNAMAVTNGEVGAYKSWLFKVNLCNGALISKRQIITAAHCVYDSPANLITLKNMDGTYLKGKKKVIIHPEYQAWGTLKIKRHDIAIIELDSEIDFEPIEIIAEHSLNDLMVIGWGKREDGSYPKIPYSISGLSSFPLAADQFWAENVELLASDDASQDFATTFRTGDYLAIEVTNGASACRGDSGAPLVTDDGKLAGVIAHGQNDCVNQSTFFVTDIVHHLDWIKSLARDEASK